MRTSSTRRSRARATASAALGMLLVGIASVPAHAAGVRDQQWHLDAMGAEKIWKISTGKGVTVAVIDSGVDRSHPDLKGQVLEGKDLAAGEEPGDQFTDYGGHGTGMAGLIAGTGQRDGGRGAYGLAPGAEILPVRVPGVDEGEGTMAESEKQFNRFVPQAIRYAADAGARVINISLASTAGSPEMTSAVKYALDKGALVFAGVGNDGEKGNMVQYPAATPGVVGVGAVDNKAKRIPMSEYGPQVDLVAPGKDLVHACGGGTGVCTSTGTSDATALASATAALLWAEHPDWTNNQVLRVMLNTVAGPSGGEKRSDHVGYGAIRPLRALTTPGDPGPADVRPIDDLKDTADPAASASATPSEGGSSANPAPAGSSAAPSAAPPAQAAADEGGNTGLWIGLGVGAAVLIGGAVAVTALRSRRT